MLQCKPTTIYAEDLAVIQFDTEVRDLAWMKHCTKQTYCSDLYSIIVKKVSDSFILNFPRRLKSNPSHCPD